jgi:ubiquinol-cytochrome c reductase cytochrome b subunit
MRSVFARVTAWLEDRTGIRTALSHFLFEEIPASSGWPQVFGSVALFVFLIQAFTGILLAFNYAATPGDAFSSVLYIRQKVAGGRIVHGLHHWGASAMIIVVCLHMVQVFVYGAYKKPRETTWIGGVFLLLFTFAFGLTGYLLPWDNKAYWGTMVTTQIVANTPLAGTFLTRLMGASDGLGVVTFSRFYALHTLVFPAVTIVLIAVHLYLVRRHGVTPAPSDPGTLQRFFPKQLFRDFIAIFVAFLCLFLAAAFLDVPLERMADPTDATYVPRPEWYFLFLFQLLKIFPGRLELIGTVVLPSVTLLLLILLPLLPDTRARIFNSRLQASFVVVLAFSIWAGLTGAAVLETPRSNSQPSIASAKSPAWARIPPEQIAGFSDFGSLRCSSCHNLVSGTPKLGPNLGLVSPRHSKEWMTEHFDREANIAPDAGAGPPQLDRSEINALSLFVSSPQSDSIETLTDLSPQFINGAKTFVSKACASCHKINGEGGSVGPPLNGLASRRSEEWVRQHFLSPQRLTPGSIMPVYRFSRSEEQDLLGYLFSLTD